MGVRGELFSNKVILPNRTYFFNVKENRMGDLYLNIVESKNRESGGFDRQSVILFADDLQEFLKGFDESLRVLEKSVREKRRAPADKDRRNSEARFTSDSDGEKTKRYVKSERADKGRKSEREYDRGTRGGRPDRSDRPDRGYNRVTKGNKPDRGYNRGTRENKPERSYNRGTRESKPDRDYNRGTKDSRRVVVRKTNRYPTSNRDDD